MGRVAAQLFSGLSRDVQSGSSLGSGWATQGHSETCPEATPVLSWLCSEGCKFYWKVNLAPFQCVCQLIEVVEEENVLFQNEDGLSGAAHALTCAIMGQIQ